MNPALWRGTCAPSQRPQVAVGARAPPLPAPPAAWARPLAAAPARATRAAAATDASSSSSSSAAPAPAARGAKAPPASAGDEWCAVAYVHVDNRKNSSFTVMEIEIADYPGLLRVVAWCLNGLEMVAQNAILSTSADGIAHNTFWLSTRRGGKLSDAAAEALAERVREVLAYCSPRPEEAEQTEFALGPIAVSNTVHSQYTVVTVAEQRRTPGFLLEVASVLSGLNVQVLQGVIQVRYVTGMGAISRGVWSKNFHILASLGDLGRALTWVAAWLAGVHRLRGRRACGVEHGWRRGGGPHL